MKRREWLLRKEHFLVVATCVFLTGCGAGKKSGGKLDSLLRTGQEQMQKGRYQEAIASFEKAISLDANAPEPYMRLALIYQECLHEPATALRYYRKYQQVEKDDVKKEEVQGWIVQLEREVADRADGRRGTTPPPEEMAERQDGAGASQGVAFRRPSDPVSSVPVGESPAYKDLQAKLASALREVRQLKAQSNPDGDLLKKLCEAEKRIKAVEGEKESLSNGLREARANALRNQQALLQAEKTNDTLRTLYEGHITDLKEKLNAAEAELRNVQASGRDARTAQLFTELQDVKRERDAAKADHSKAAEEMARLKKTVNAYAATLSSLQKLNDELRKENASLQSRLSGGSERPRHHVVRAGETLKKIAGYGSVYGDSKKWFLIYEANKDKVRDPNKLTPGLVLVIPPG